MVVQEIDITSTGRGRKNTGLVLCGHTLNACPPPILPGIARTPWTRPKVGGPADRALEARLSPSHPPYPRAFLARSLALTAHDAARRSCARLQVAACGRWRSGTAPRVRKLVHRCAHPSATLARRQLALTGRSPAHPLVPTSHPTFHLLMTLPGPDPAAVLAVGDVAGSMIYLLVEPDTLSASVCGSADGQGAIFSVEVRDAWVRPAVGRSSQCVLGDSNVYIG